MPEPAILTLCCYLTLNALATLPANTEQDDVEARNAAQPGLSMALGAHPRPWLRTELELGWRQSQIHGYGEESADGDINIGTLLANAWLSPFGPQRSAVPYLGAGIGGGIEHVDGSSGSQSRQQRRDTEAIGALQLGAGVRVRLPGDQLTLDIGYRWLTSTGESEYHTALVGLSYQFGGSHDH